VTNHAMTDPTLSAMLNPLSTSTVHSRQENLMDAGGDADQTAGLLSSRHGSVGGQRRAALPGVTLLVARVLLLHAVLGAAWSADGLN